MSTGADGSVIIDTELDESGLLKGLSNLSSTVIDGVTKALKAATGAIVALGAYSVKVGSDFESSMSQVGATMGMTVEEIQNGSSEFEALKEAAIEMGSTTAFTCSEAAEALNYMALAGYDAETSIAMLPNVLSLAAAGSIDLAYASDMITDSQTALGLTLDETKVLVDQMAKAASKSNTSVEQLGEAILTVGGTAQYMAGGTEELNTVLGLLADNGIKGSEAGTHLRNMILKLASPTDDAAALIKDLGVEIFDAEGRMRSFADIFPDLNAAMADFTDEEKIQAFSTLFNVRDVAAANALLGTSIERWDELGDAILDSAGAAEQMAAVQLDNLQGDLTLLKSATEGFGIALYDNIQAPLRDLAQEGIDLMGQLNEAVLNDGLSGLAGAVGSALAQAVTKLASYAPNFVQGAADLVSGLVQGFADAAPSISEAATSCLATFVDALFEISGDLVTLGGELMLSLASGLSANADSIIHSAASGIVGLAETILEYLPQMVSAGADLIFAIAEGILGAIPVLLEALPSIVDSLIVGIGEAAGALIEGVSEVILAVAEALPELIQQIVVVLPELVQSICDGIVTYVPMLISAGITLLTALVKDLPKIINTICLALPSLISSIVSSLLGMIPQLVSCGVDLLVSLVQALPDIIYAIVSVLPVIISSIVAALLACIPEIIQCGIELLVSLVSALPEIIITIIAVIPSIIASIIAALIDSIPLIIQCGIELFVALIGALPEIIVALVGAIPQIISSIIEALLSNIPVIINAGIQLLTSLITALPQIIATLIKAAPQIISALVQAFINLKGKFVEAGSNLLKGIGDGIANAVGSVVSKAVQAAKKILSSVKNFFGIASPSKVFRDMIGKNLMLGLAGGIADESQTAVDAVKDAAKEISAVDFDVSVPDFDDDIDYENLVARGVAVVSGEVSTTGKSVSDSAANQIYRSGGLPASDTTNDGDDKSNPEYIQNDIIIDGKRAARVLTPYVAKELEWEDR